MFPINTKAKGTLTTWLNDKYNPKITRKMKFNSKLPPKKIYFRINCRQFRLF